MTTASQAFRWPNGKKAAVSLTFDDARLTQIDRGIPLLNEFGVKASFYVSMASMEKRLPGWRDAVKQGHEIGNHSVHHPCSGNFAFIGKNALEEYTFEQMEFEIVEANAMIEKQVGVKARSFAYPCGQTFVGRGENVRSYVPIVARHFTVGRGFPNEWCNNPLRCDLAQVFGVDADCKTFPQLKYFLDLTLKQGGWIIFVGHDMAIEARQSVSEKTLRELCGFISDPSNGYWVDTVANVGAFVAASRSKS